MKIFTHLRNIIKLEQDCLTFIDSLEDRDIVASVGYHEMVAGEPLTLKHLFQLDIGSIATIQRRVTRLVELGVLIKKRDRTDRRVFTLHLGLNTKRDYPRFEVALAA